MNTWWRTALTLAWLGVFQACGRDASPAAPSSSTTVSPPATQTSTLAVAATAVAKYVGAAVQSGLLRDGTYQGVVSREFGSVTAEFEMKWNTHEPSRGSFNFGPGDAIVASAQAAGLQVRGHTLIWHGSVPSWVDALSADALRTEVAEHIRTVVGHYRGRVRAWDVVNEAIDGAGLRDTVFRRGMGDDYIAEAFRLAREADPGALLFYNDFGAEGLGSKSDRVYNLVKGLKDSGVPIDGVGMQMHVSANSRPSDADLAANMRRLGALGLRVAITEMDVKLGVGGSQQSRLDLQREAYRAIVRVCVTEPRCEGLTFWGFTDAHSWLASDLPLLFDTQYQPKPAYYGVLDGLQGR